MLGETKGAEVSTSLSDIISSRFFSLVILGVLGAVVFGAIIFFPSHSILFEGDFAPFYAAATLLKDPNTAIQIYDPVALSAIQKQIWPQMTGVYLVGYPPYVIALFIPFTGLDPVSAKALFVFLSITAVVVSSFFLVRMFPHSSDIRAQTIATFFCFAPLFHGVFGGQNASFSLLLFTLALFLFLKKTPLADLISGLVLGLWLFKPHFSLVIILGFLCARRFLILPTLTLTAVGYYLLAKSYLGADWLLLWLQGLELFVPADFQNNSHQMMSLLGVTQSILLLAQIDDLTASIATFVISGLSLIILFFSLKPLMRTSKDAHLSQAHAIIMLANVAILISPHTLYYDAALFLPALYIWLQKVPVKKQAHLVLFFLLFSGLSVSLKEVMPFSLMLIPSLCLLLLQKPATSRTFLTKWCLEK